MCGRRSCKLLNMALDNRLQSRMCEEQRLVGVGPSKKSRGRVFLSERKVKFPARKPDCQSI